MSDLTNTAPLAKCPICRRPHETRPVIEIDLTYCPRCGAPHFFEAGTGGFHVTVDCFVCRSEYNPAYGGGAIVKFRMWAEVQELETPRGLFQGLRLVMPS